MAAHASQQPQQAPHQQQHARQSHQFYPRSADMTVHTPPFVPPSSYGALTASTSSSSSPHATLSASANQPYYNVYDPAQGHAGPSGSAGTRYARPHGAQSPAEGAHDVSRASPASSPATAAASSAQTAHQQQFWQHQNLSRSQTQPQHQPPLPWSARYPTQPPPPPAHHQYNQMHPFHLQQQPQQHPHSYPHSGQSRPGGAGAGMFYGSAPPPRFNTSNGSSSQHSPTTRHRGSTAAMSPPYMPMSPVYPPAGATASLVNGQQLLPPFDPQRMAMVTPSQSMLPPMMQPGFSHHQQYPVSAQVSRLFTKPDNFDPAPALATSKSDKRLRPPSLSTATPPFSISPFVQVPALYKKTAVILSAENDDKNEGASNEPTGGVVLEQQNGPAASANVPPTMTAVALSTASSSAATSVETSQSTTTNTASSTPMTPKSPASTAASTPAGMKRSWADLLRSPAGTAPGSPLVNGSSSAVAITSPPPSSSRNATYPASLAPQKRTLAQALQGVEHAFANANIVPRGLINNGNLCFANAILQVLVYCSPFWNLMALIRSETRQDLSGKTPTMDAMQVLRILMNFLDEFKSSSKVSVVSRHRQKSSTAGSTSTPPPADSFIPLPASDWSDPFVPEAVYESLKPNKRFEPMTKGHQEDAEEFLGFFLDTLHDEILYVIDRADKDQQDDKVAENGDDGWLEVGSKGRTATTRTTETRESPITRIFGGQLRSVLRCPGQKDSITLEPYQRLQLDISPDHVKTIEDALLNLTLPEPLPDFVSRSGLRVEATKQVFLETFPPVLILHLKRFLYDNVGGVQKSGKVVGYGTELEIAQDIIGPAKRSGQPARYQLFGVVYHHGLYASGGHYTVAVRQQLNSHNWLHIDDTQIRTISPADVAVGREGAYGTDSEKSAYLLLYSKVA
ncbi:hypothetical protein OIV83_004451 [Microbotryomycetes sp. JL201]|nr:hypothetical protein OIV83_004451 [Microbotryomycetes sp. JL201]